MLSSCLVNSMPDSPSLVKQPWSVTAYISKVPLGSRMPKDPNAPDMPPEEKKRFKSFFPSPDPAHYDNGTTVVDKSGRVLLWHLPKILHPIRVVSGIQEPIFFEWILNNVLRKQSIRLHKSSTLC